MRITRIHVPGALAVDRTIAIEGPAADHMVRVLRLKPGASLIVFNGEGGEYRATVQSLRRGHVEALLSAFEPRDVESPLGSVLVQGVSRGERMDYTIQKAVELGVSAIVPVFSERSVVNLRGERMALRQRHWQAVATGACEQCGRNRVPPVHAARSLSDWLGSCNTPGLKLLLDPQGEVGIHELRAPDQGIVLLVGPEGGLSAAERTEARTFGFQGMRLGPRVLRTETAAVVALAALQTLWGDLR